MFPLGSDSSPGETVITVGAGSNMEELEIVGGLEVGVTVRVCEEELHR